MKKENEHKKDFDNWNIKKKKINDRPTAPFYHEREVWWCSLGINVGFEQDGTGENYDRPVLIIRGFNTQVFFGLALTGRKREGKFHVYLGKIEDQDASVILSQVRLIDSKRLVHKMGTIDEALFEKVCEALKDTLFGKKKA